MCESLHLLSHLKKQQKPAKRGNRKQRRRERNSNLTRYSWWDGHCCSRTSQSVLGPNKHILQLYRARWQIELLFKRMKQMMAMHVTRSKTPQGCESSLLAWLIVWALQEQEAQEARNVLHQVHRCLDSPALDLPEGELSQWLLTSICLQTLFITIQGHWTKSRLYLCLPYLQRFLYGSPKKEATFTVQSGLFSLGQTCSYFFCLT